LAYTLEVQSTKGSVKFRLVTGPKGMAVSDAGRLTRDVPADCPDQRADVFLQVTDAGTQNVSQAFSLVIEGP
jgi:hypothetical protein